VVLKVEYISVWGAGKTYWVIVTVAEGATSSFTNHVANNLASCNTQQHPLILLKTSPNHELCYFCNEYIFLGFTYNCSHCNFNLHLKCASIPVTVKTEFHDPPLKLLWKSVSFTCDACGKEDKDMSYLCIDVTCPLIVHLKCAALLLIVKNTSYHHALSLTCSSQVNQSYRRICCLCVKKVDT
jgi:hypothetical protein